MLGFSRGSHSLISGDPDRGTFVSYFLGAIVPLGALGFMIGRYTALSAGWLGGALGFAALESTYLLGLFVGISSLSLACFFLLRQLVRGFIHMIRQLVQFDTLTGLPNRRLFKDRAEQVLLHSER